jgi:hypothetical protein
LGKASLLLAARAQVVDAVQTWEVLRVLAGAFISWANANLTLALSSCTYPAQTINDLIINTDLQLNVLYSEYSILFSAAKLEF